MRQDDVQDIAISIQIKNFVVELKFKTGITIKILFFTPCVICYALELIVILEIGFNAYVFISLELIELSSINKVSLV